MKSPVVERLAKDLAGDTREHVARTVNPALDRIAALEQAVRQITVRLDTVKDGKDGRDGKDADVDALTKHVESSVAAAIANVPRPIPEPPIPGPKGEPGESIKGEPGEPGPPGKDGKDAEPISVQQVQEAVTTALPGLLQTAVKAYLEEHPPASGKDGTNGRDGVGVAGAVIDRDGHLILTLSDGSQKGLGLVVGKDGTPGAPGAKGLDGKDGFGFDECDAEYDEHGRMYLIYRRGEDVKRFRVPGHADQGVYRAETKYLKGDTSTWAGSLWIAQVDDPSGKPGTEGSGWRLAVKRGDIGKIGPPGPEGRPGVRGEKGDPGGRY